MVVSASQVTGNGYRFAPVLQGDFVTLEWVLAGPEATLGCCGKGERLERQRTCRNSR